MEFAMLARLSLASGCVLALCLQSPGLADEGQFGALDFSRLSQPQEQFFWRRLKSLALEEAALTYCGQSDDFETRTKQGIQSCVTAAALNKAESFLQSELKAELSAFREDKRACNAKLPATSGWLGIDLTPAGKDTLAGKDTPAPQAGALVAGAIDGSPAARADLKAGDVITSVNAEAIANPQALSAKIRALAPGTTVQLGVLRNGAGRTVGVKLGAMAFDKQGRVAFDMPSLVASSKDDLKSVSDQVTEMCRKCKTTIWAIFCH